MCQFSASLPHFTGFHHNDIVFITWRLFSVLTNKHVWIQLWFVCMCVNQPAKVLVSWAFIQRDSVERYRKCGRKKEEDLQQRTSGWSVDEASARSTCFQRVYLSVSRNYWTDFHFTWMEDESQCTLDHVIFCCGGISSHFLKRWQIMCGSGWEQFHSAPTMKSGGNSCWEGWNTVVSVWVGLKVRLLDWEAANLSDKLVKCLNRRFLIWRRWWSRAVTFRIGLYVLTVFSSTSESSTSTFVLL